MNCIKDLYVVLLGGGGGKSGWSGDGVGRLVVTRTVVLVDL
jgi:hypothetical protein